MRRHPMFVMKSVAFFLFRYLSIGGGERPFYESVGKMHVWTGYTNKIFKNLSPVRCCHGSIDHVILPWW